MRKISLLGILMVLVISFSSVYILGADFDYSTALRYSIYFFDANKCGYDVSDNNVFDWRGPCHLNDGEDVGVDLTGGFHDAGDHVKFGLPQAYAASILGWSLYKYEDVFENTGTKQNLLSTLKYFTDYLLKCHPDPDTFYYQVGDGGEDHAYWGAPEEQTEDRPTLFVANESNPASDVLGLTSSALTIMYLNYQGIDSAYAEECLQAAKELYQMGSTNLGYYAESSFYISYSFYDDLAWAASWLYIVEGDTQYLEDAENFVVQQNKKGEDPLENRWTMCWDNMYLPAMFKLYQLTNKNLYKNALEYNLNYWLNSLQTTPGGLKYLDNWGVLRYALAESMLALAYYEETGGESLKNFARSQLDYALGDNPANMSYVIGFGNTWSKHPHHRAANGYTYANGDNQKEAKHVLLGALVGGPDQNDNYIDDVNQYQYTEVALDYNAGLVGVLAGILDESDPNNNDDQVVAGDASGDSVVNSVDYVLLRRYLLGIVSEFDYEYGEIAADINEDGTINSVDYVLLRRMLLGTN